ncbi:MAG: sensor histidine kinase, partial [Gaiellaceae bacterium]
AASNLLDNAAKWSPEGGVVAVSLRGGTLQVRDHGPGIDEGDLPHVFERFYRGAGGRDRPGSGLGLAIVAQVVSAHGGEVRAERATGGGALLTARFPSDS